MTNFRKISRRLVKRKVRELHGEKVVAIPKKFALALTREVFVEKLPGVHPFLWEIKITPAPSLPVDKQEKRYGKREG